MPRAPARSSDGRGDTRPRAGVPLVQRAGGGSRVLAADGTGAQRVAGCTASPTRSRPTGSSSRRSPTRRPRSAERLTGEVDSCRRPAPLLRRRGRRRFLPGVTVDDATATTPRLVRVNRPLGPVAVFGASNFPFAFSVLGNDTGVGARRRLPRAGQGAPRAHRAEPCGRPRSPRPRSPRRARPTGPSTWSSVTRPASSLVEAADGHRGGLHRVADRRTGPVAAGQRARGGHPGLRRDGHREPGRRDRGRAPPTWSGRGGLRRIVHPGRRPVLHQARAACWRPAGQRCSRRASRDALRAGGDRPRSC